MSENLRESVPHYKPINQSIQTQYLIQAHKNAKPSFMTNRISPGRRAVILRETSQHKSQSRRSISRNSRLQASASTGGVGTSLMQVLPKQG